MEENKISKIEIVKAIEDSGYLIEQRVEPIITNYGYYVETNDIYIDHDTGKNREVDLTATMGLKISEDHFLWPHLVIECENNKQPIVFFRSESPIKFLFHEDIKLAGIPLPIYTIEDEPIMLTDFLNFEKFHHYCSGNFSTQYCSFQLSEKRNLKKWIALHPESQHDTFQGLIKCVEYNINEFFSNYQLLEKGEEEYADIQIFYPILVLQGDLFEAFLNDGKLNLIPRDHIQFRKQIANQKDQVTYQIDVITEKFLPEYLKIIEKENRSILRRLRRDIKEIEHSIKILVDSLRKSKDKSEYRNILDF